jgi:hypothetical protein
MCGRTRVCCSRSPWRTERHGIRHREPPPGAGVPLLPREAPGAIPLNEDPPQGADAARAFLRRHAPFDAMSDAASHS